MMIKTTNTNTILLYISKQYSNTSLLCTSLIEHFDKTNILNITVKIGLTVGLFIILLHQIKAEKIIVEFSKNYPTDIYQ